MKINTIIALNAQHLGIYSKVYVVMEHAMNVVIIHRIHAIVVLMGDIFRMEHVWNNVQRDTINLIIKNVKNAKQS